MQSFDRACPASMLERLILFGLFDQNFWIQWFSGDATALYLFECRPKYIDTKVCTKVYHTYDRSSQQRSTNIVMHLVPTPCALELGINFLALTAPTLLLQRPRCW